MNFSEWAQGIAAVIGVPSVLAAAIAGFMQIRIMRRDRRLIFEPKCPAKWTTPHHKNSYAVSFAIDIRNPSQQGFVIHSVALRNPEGTDLAYPGTGRVKDQAPLEIDFDCPPGLRTLQLYAEGAALVSAKSLSITAIFSRFRGQRLTVDPCLDSRLSFGGRVGRADWTGGRRVGDHRCTSTV